MEHIEIQNLSFAYPGKEEKALIDVSFTIGRGQYITVCGKSGSGKTTLLRHFKNVLVPHGKMSGQILFDGKPVKEMSLKEQASRIGYVMQNPDNQIVTDKVWHELAFGLESLGFDRKTIRLRVAEMASYFGIQGWFHKNVAELSGGQKQLLNLASIMAMQPEILILDEPTSQLDPIAASDFLNTVKKINRELRTTVIITEHRLEDIFYASDTVVVMENGRLIYADEPAKTGAFLKEENNEMFAAMPTPVQVYYGVGSELSCPLTVREGGTWLDDFLEKESHKENLVTALDYEADLSDEADAAVTLKEVWFRYEKDAPDVLKGLSLQVPRSSIFSIVGGNGTGKSTTLKTICEICRPYRGKVKVNGSFAMLPQDPQSIFVKKTVEEELLEMLPSGKRNLEAIEEISKICEIDGLLKSHPYDLSGGEQQRAALAKVLLTEPEILLLDEPTKGIDNFFKKKLAEILKELQQRGVTVIMVSHDVEFCARYADSVSMFFDGSIITTNTPRRFFSRNSFYTTAANRMSRHVFENAITDEDVIKLCKENR